VTHESRHNTTSQAALLARKWPLFWSSNLLPGSGDLDDCCAACPQASYALREGRWKLLAWRGWFGCDVSVIRHFTNSSIQKVELYDLDADPGERADLSLQEPTRVLRMRKLLDAVRRENVRVAPTWNLDCSLPAGIPLKHPAHAPPSLLGMCRCLSTRQTVAQCGGSKQRPCGHDDLQKLRASGMHSARSAFPAPLLVVERMDLDPFLAAQQAAVISQLHLRKGTRVLDGRVSTGQGTASSISWYELCAASIPAQHVADLHARTAFAVEAWIARAHARLTRELDASKADSGEAEMPGVLLLTVAHSDLFQTTCPDLLLEGGDIANSAPALWPGDMHAARSSSPDLNLCSAAARAERLPPLAEALASATSRIASAQVALPLVEGSTTAHMRQVLCGPSSTPR